MTEHFIATFPTELITDILYDKVKQFIGINGQTTLFWSGLEFKVEQNWHLCSDNKKAFK